MTAFRTFPQKDWDATPGSVQDAFNELEKKCKELSEVVERRNKTIEKQRSRLGQNSKNSSKPPSSDTPYQKPPPKKSPRKKKGKPGAKPGHQGHRQKLLPPTREEHIPPGKCQCGNCVYPDTEAFYIHQEIELPKIEVDVNHFILHKGTCPDCGKVNKASVPVGHQTGYGPALTALIGDMAGNQTASRSTIQEFCACVLNFHISLGAVQKVIDRCSEAVRPHYNAIADVVRKSAVNHIDETTFPKNGDLAWLWVMACPVAALFMIHPNRSKAAFEKLVQDWQGILVSDGYSLYRKWAIRQSCLAHLIRRAIGLSQRDDPDIASFGKQALRLLRMLCRMSKFRPTKKLIHHVLLRLTALISKHQHLDNDAGKMAKHLSNELLHLVTFLKHEGVAPTNNLAERMLRFGVLWRKRSLGTASDKGERWVERVLTLRQTCRLNSKKPYAVMKEAVSAFLFDQESDLSWIMELE